MLNKYYKKIIRIGENSLGIILPIEWTRYNNVRGGDYVVVLSNSEILIRLLQKDEEKIDEKLKKKTKGDNR